MNTTTYDAPSENLSYVRKVYAWLFGGVLTTALAAFASVNLGSPTQIVHDGRTIAVPPLVGAFVDHPYASFFLFLGMVMVAGITRRVPIINGIVYFALTVVMGLFIGPAIFATQLRASAGQTLSAHPVHDALGLTILGFGGLTAYVFASKKDFSAWGGFLMTGLIVLVVASFLAIFSDSSALHLALSSVGVILFTGFILFDTSTILHKSDLDDPIGDALNLLLDLLNIFVSLLQILGAPVKKD